MRAAPGLLSALIRPGPLISFVTTQNLTTVVAFLGVALSFQHAAVLGFSCIL